MPEKSLYKTVLITALLISAGVITCNVLNAPDKRSGAQKISDAVDELPNGVSKAAQQLESRTPADKLQDAAEEAADDLKNSTNQQ